MLAKILQMIDKSFINHNTETMLYREREKEKNEKRPWRNTQFNSETTGNPHSCLPLLRIYNHPYAILGKQPLAISQKSHIV